MIKEERESNWEVESNEYGWTAELREQKHNDLLSNAAEWEKQNYAEIETGLISGEGLTVTTDLWELIEPVEYPQEELIAEYEAMQKDMNMYKDLYQDADEVLRTVRHNIGTPEGESVIDYSAQFSAPPGIADDMPYLSVGTMNRIIDEYEKEETSKQFDKAMDGLIDG